MKIYELFLIVVFVCEMVIVIGFPLYICMTSDNNCTTIFKELNEWFFELFYNKNLFGKILSCLAIIIFLPGILMTLIFNILFYIIALFKWIWDLGNKNN